MTNPAFYPLDFTATAQLTAPSQLEALIAAARQTGATDLLFLTHGFRCDEAEATALYTAMLANLRPRLAAVNGKTFAVAGVYWPSQKFPEAVGTAQSVHTNLASLIGLASSAAAVVHAATLLDRVIASGNAQNDFVSAVLSAFGTGQDDPAEGLPLLHQIPGAELLGRLQPDKILDGIDLFLNFMSWSAMKKLSGDIGANGLATAVETCRRELPAAKIHLLGHSLGGRLVTACCKSLAQIKAEPIASLTLLEAAFSHFGFSPDAGWGEPGFFRPVLESKIVRGPLISTFSKRDLVVGTAYAVASRLDQDRLQAIGDAADPYGGIGHNGAQRTPESTVLPLHSDAPPYRFQPGLVTCLDGSTGAITGHGDVTNAIVMNAAASAICPAN